MKFVDLSVPINQDTPVYPGDPKTKVEPVGQLAKDGFNDHFISMGTHIGTHIDAPMHMLDGGKSLDQLPLDQFVGRGVYVQVDGSFNLDTIKAANIQSGDIVIFDTGMSKKYHEAVYFENYPAMAEEVAQYLIDKKVKMVGLDTGSADNQDGFPIHKLLLGGNVLIIENLTNVSALDGQKFTIYALPLNLQIDGSPARVIAQIN